MPPLLRRKLPKTMVHVSPQLLTGGIFILGLGLFPLFNPSNYWLHVGALVFVYVALGLGLNIVVGLAGLLDLGYVAFYAVGAYRYALLAVNHPVPYGAVLFVGGGPAAVIS